MTHARGFSAKLTIGLILVVVTLSVASLATLDLSTAANARHVAEARSYFDDLLVAQRLRAAVEQAVASSRGYLLTGRTDFIDRMSESRETAERLLGLLDHRARSAGSRQLVTEMKRAAGAYDAIARAAISHRKLGGTAASVAYIFERELVPSRRRLDDLLASFVQSQQRQFQLGSERIERDRARTLLTVVGTLSMGVLVSAALALALARHLNSLYRREQVAIASAERAAAAREELLATVAHDLRSPLGAIALRATTLRRTSRDEGAKKHAEAIERVVKRMDHLVKGLLDVATMEAGRLALEQSSFPVTAIIQEVIDLFGDTAASQSVRLENRSHRSQLLLRADRERSIQVLSNIVVNAIKFTPPQGQVEVSAEPAEEASVRISVRDTGPGIAADTLPHVFDRFWKAGPRGRAGTGLGLHIAREIVTAHGGHIWAESQPGSGTTFHFTLPGAPAPGPQSDAAPACTAAPPRPAPVPG
jgi:signal transduction histidine kinase